MAKLTLTNAKLTVGGIDLSSRVRSITLNTSADMQDVTTMNSSSWHERLAGLRDWSLDVEFVQDYAAGSVDDTLWPKLGGAQFTVAINPVNAATSTTNPQYSGPASLSAYNPIAGSVGEGQMATATFTSCNALARATS